MKKIFLLFSIFLVGACFQFQSLAHLKKIPVGITLQQAYRGLVTREDFARAASLELHVVSDLLADQISNLVKTNSPAIVDIVGIGAGSQSAIAFSILKQKNPNLRTLIFEASPNAGTFDHLRGSFYLNSPEGRVQDGITLHNTIIGSPIQVFDLVSGPEDDLIFPSSQKLGDATLLAHLFSDSGLVFNQRVVKVEPGAPHATYRVVTDKGLIVFTNHILIATGLGAPKTGIDDAVHRQSVERITSDGNPAVETVDQFLNRLSETRYARRGTSTDQHLEILPAEVLVIGAGDGGKIAVEALLKWPESNRPKILWAGQDATTPAEFMESLKHPILKERYAETGQSLLTGWVRALPGRITQVERKNGSDSEFEVTLQNEKPSLKITKRTFRKIIFATGYTSELPNIFEDLPGFDSKSGETLFGSLSDFVTLDEGRALPLRRYPLGWKARGHSIWRIGPGSVSEMEDSRKYGGYFDLSAYAPLSAAVGELLASTILLHPRTEVADVQANPEFEAFWTLPSGTNSPLHVQKDLFFLEAKLVIGRLIQSLRLPPDQRLEVELIWKFNPSEKQIRFHLGNGNFDPVGLSRFKENIQKETGLGKFWFYSLGEEWHPKLRIFFQSRSDGTPRLETLKVE
ncbi:MAG: hypothetical protein HYX41_01770 [Bdellovibrio sp.]|nr:hypothetical protein [Bdellovibrio sp.]